jgi:hypothetical protein
MSGLRLLLRATPFLLGAVAAALWLRREAAELPQLEPPKRPERRFEREPVDIVTVVDDLLLADRE